MKTNSYGRLDKEVVFWLGLIHIGALLAIPLFSWDALAVCLGLLFTVGPIGVNLCYHRLLSHRSFKTSKWFEYVLATIGAFTAQGPVLNWVAAHRHHHRYSDQADKDIHTPNRGGFWGAHLLAIVHTHEIFTSDEKWMKYVPDLLKSKYYRFLSKYNILFALSTLPLLYWAGGLPYVMWGGFVRVVLMLHATWFVNSAAHMWGYRNFNTSDRSTNNWWVAILAAGEGWHNNHHAQPKSAAHGMRWFEFDLTYMYIRLFEALGLVYDVKRPDFELLDAKKATLDPVLDS